MVGAFVDAQCGHVYVDPHHERTDWTLRHVLKHRLALHLTPRILERRVLGARDEINWELRTMHFEARILISG